MAADRSSIARRLGPLPGLAIALLLVVAVLPSALNVPQSNPTTTPEFAPVPPQDQRNQPPQAGNFAGIGFASSLGVGAGTLPARQVSGDPATAVATLGKTPRTKLCVGNPPRQTEDPLSPPCVAYFTGDNGGATAKAVAADEVRVVLYLDAGTTYVDRSSGKTYPTPPKHYDDLAKPADPATEHPFTQMLRLFQSYFNSRYQTYQRFVHLWVYYSTPPGDSGQVTPEERRADAADNIRRIRPFAVVNFAGSNAGDYLEAMARQGVAVFGSTSPGLAGVVGHDLKFFQRFPTLVWDYNPALEYRAQLVASYVCRKIVPYPVSFSGNSLDRGKPRRLGLLSTSDPGYPELKELTALIVRDLKRECGATFVQRATFPTACCAVTPGDSSGATNMASFRQAGVTTILWTGGLNNSQTTAASTMAYYPEWVAVGDGILDTADTGLVQAQDEWRNAWMISTLTLRGPINRSQCVEAAKSVQPDARTEDITRYGCFAYNDLQQLFTGIQVAGPRLRPASMSEGFHAIPAVPSTSPRVPACFYLPRDYTCVKDAVAEWWDPTGQDPNYSNPGCLRMAIGGRRFLAQDWPKGDAESMKASSDPCSGN